MLAERTEIWKWYFTLNQEKNKIWQQYNDPKRLLQASTLPSDSALTHCILITVTVQLNLEIITHFKWDHF